MILPIILFILIIILISAFLVFLFYIFFPSLKKQGYDIHDIIISDSERNYNVFIFEDEKPIKTEKRAIVLCSCKKEFSLKPINLNEMHSCFMVKNIYGSGVDCKYACIGLGDCVKVCPQKAIEIKNKTAIITKLCIGCGRCEKICPQNIIKLVPKNTQSYILCNIKDDETMTSCSEQKKEQKIEWNDSKHFKIWAYWYKLIKSKK